MTSDPDTSAPSAASSALRSGGGALAALPVSPRERAARRALAVATLVSACGLAVAGTVDRTIGGVITVAGWVVLVFALHSLGRAATPG